MRRQRTRDAPLSPSTASTMRCWTPQRREPSRCTTCPHTPARRYPLRSSTASGSGSGIRLRTGVMRRRRCSSCSWPRPPEVLAPGPERIAPVAEHPGVPWQVLPYERQLQIKRSQVEEALRRIGRLEGYELEEIVPAVQPWRYRNKLEYSFGADEHGALVCGFHAPAG